jgi:lipopolysaccharide transport system ATP-binding protein
MIKFQDTSIGFPVNTHKNYSLRKAVVGSVVKNLGGTISQHNKFTVINALNHLNFEINEGDKVGLFGPNGSGKSTLLKTIAGIYPPTTGTINVTGKINNLLNIGYGFNAELTGEKAAEFRLIVADFKGNFEKKIEDIKNFSGLEEYFHLPIKTYSSGMSFRLAFSIVSQLEGDILLMDEWLSAGDESFISKVNLKLQEIIKSSKILVLASHSKELLKTNCNKLMVLQNGNIEYLGEMLNEF